MDLHVVLAHGGLRHLHEGDLVERAVVGRWTSKMHLGGTPMRRALAILATAEALDTRRARRRMKRPERVPLARAGVVGVMQLLRAIE